MKLSILLRGLDSRQADHATDPLCAGLAYDSRQVTPGKVYFALSGKSTDGHLHAAEAVARGAVAVVSERDCGLPSDVVKVFVDNTRRALAHAASTYYRQPSRDLQVIGITGTNGKTTVAFMVRDILKSVEVRTGMIGTIEYDIGSRVMPATRTTPESLELQNMLQQMRLARCEVCVMEVSSHAIEQYRVEAVDFDKGVFTNLTQDHLDYHGNMESYFASKKKLFDLLDEDKGVFVNLDDKYGARLMTAGRHSYGFNENAMVRAREIELNGFGTQLLLESVEGLTEIKLPFIGRHNIYNALAAYSVTRSMGVEAKDISEALSTMLPTPGRLEPIRVGQPFNLYVDYAHTDDALRQVLGALNEITVGRLLVVFGCGGNRDKGKRKMMGEIAAAHADEIIITTDNPRNENPAVIAEEVAEGCQQVRQGGFEVELDRARAIDEIIRRAREGDTVLLAGKGHETYQETGEIVQPFDDREKATETLQALGFSG